MAKGFSLEIDPWVYRAKFGEDEGRIQVNVPGVGELRSIARQPDERMVEITMLFPTG